MHTLHYSTTRKNKVFEDQMVMQGVPILVTLNQVDFCGLIPVFLNPKSHSKDAPYIS